jgi:peptide/nickel transport system substrate-binding protein
MRDCLKFVGLTVLCLALGAMPALAKGDTLTVALTQTPKTLDPQATPDAGSQNIALQIYETLLVMDKDNKLVPVLAEKWEAQPDKVSYKFTLKKGVKFHNGETMTADDVVYTYKRALSSAGVAVKALSMYLADVQKVDDDTVVLKSAKPMGDTFLVSLSHPWASIMNQKTVEAAGKDYGQKPVGTGKFMFKNWIIGDRVELTRFDDYHGRKAKLKDLVFRTIVEASSRTIELESGAVDLIMDPSPNDINRIKDNKNLEVVSVPSCRLYYIGLDVTKAPYDNLKVRQAVNLAVDRPGIVKIVFRGFAEPARGPVTSAIKYNKYKETPPINKDVPKAKELLKEAGFPNGFKGKIIISDRTDYTNIGTILQANFKEAGIDMQIEVFEWGAFLDVIRKQGHDPFLNNWWGGAPAMDPFFLMTPPFHSSAIGQTNRHYFKDDVVDAALDLGVTLPDGPERSAAYAKAWDRINEQLPWIPMVQPLNMYGQAKGLKGIDHSPSILNYLGNAYFEK